MPRQATNQTNLDLTFPISFLKSVTLLEEGHIFNAKLNDNSCSLKVFLSTTTEEFIRFNFNVQVPFKSNKTKRICDVINLKFSDIQSGVDILKSEISADNLDTTETNAQNVKSELKETSFDSKPTPKKRGRPKNVDKAEKRQVEPCVPAELPEVQVKTSEGRYSLRGVKLSSKIMKMEKGNDNDAFESESDDDHDEDASMGDADNIQEISNQIGTGDCEGASEPLNTDLEQNMKFKADNNSSKTTDSESFKISSEFEETPFHQHNSEKTVRSKYDNAKMNTIEAQKIFKENKSKSITCFLCLKSEKFKNKRQLKIHQDEKHSDLKCLWCGNDKKYKHMSSLKSHFLWMHGKYSTMQPHMCHLCPSQFKFASTLKQHIEEIHEGQIKVKCDICHKQFYRLSQLTRHKKIHGDAKKKLLCPTCGKGFWHDTNRQRHIRLVHNPHLEMFQCSYCGKSFSQKSGMISHIKRMHFNLVNFRCDHCSVTFIKSKDLENHMIQVHDQRDFKVTEPRPTRFKYNRNPDDLLHCPTCSKSFCYKAELIEHMYIFHADDFPFKCERCHQGFMRKPFLNRHRKLAHKDVLTPEEEEELTMAITVDESTGTLFIEEGEELDDSGVMYVTEEGTDENVTYVSNFSMENLKLLKDKKNVTFVSNDGEENFVTILNFDNNVSLQDGSTAENSQENVTFVTNYDYENTEEVETTLDILTNTSSTAGGEQSSGNPLTIEVEEEGKTIRYVIHPSKDGKTPNLGADDITKLIMAAKHGSDSDPQVDNISNSDIKYLESEDIEFQT